MTLSTGQKGCVSGGIGERIRGREHSRQSDCNKRMFTQKTPRTGTSYMFIRVITNMYVYNHIRTFICIYIHICFVNTHKNLEKQEYIPKQRDRGIITVRHQKKKRGLGKPQVVRVVRKSEGAERFFYYQNYQNIS